MVIAQGTNRLIHQGVDQGYVEITEEMAGLRGKLLIREMAKRAVRAKGKTICQFEKLSFNILHNQILYTTLANLLKIDGFDTKLRSTIKSVYDKLSGISTIRLSNREFRRVQLDRNRHIYRYLLSFYELLYNYLIVTEEHGHNRFVDFRKDERRMWQIFEDFVIEFYSRELNSFQVNRPGRKILWSDAGTKNDQRKFLTNMYCDVYLESSDRRIVLDTKYYQQSTNTYGNLRSEHLYQLLAYLRNREATTPDGPKHEGILLYPVVNESFEADVVLEGFSIKARSVDLGQDDWRGIHRDLLAMIND